MLLAELNVRHTRRHMPTRRVAVEHLYLPTSGPACGGLLLGAVVAEHLEALDEEQFEALERLVATAKRGALSVPRIALRYRLQTDTHGLELSRHRIVAADPLQGRNLPVLELDCHGRAAPQVIGAVMAAAELPPTGRQVAFRFVEAAIRAPASCPAGSSCSGGGRRGPERRRPLPGPWAAGPAVGTPATVTRGGECRPTGGGRSKCWGSPTRSKSNAPTSRSGSGASCGWPTPTMAPSTTARRNGWPS